MENKLKLTIEPTHTVREIDGVECREWRGRDQEGVEIVAYVRAVTPQTDDENVAERYRRHLQDLGYAKAAAVDLRKIL